MLIETECAQFWGRALQSAPSLEETGMDEQNGFTTNSGCTYGIFFDQSGPALQKRREHGLDTWALFVDLILVDKGV